MNEVENAIADYTRDRSPDLLRKLEQRLIGGTFIVPVSMDVQEFAPSSFDIPVICLRRDDGAGVLPAFTTVERLLSWKPQGTKYVELEGRTLIEMAQRMTQIDEVSVNPNGGPRGSVPRAEFERLLAI